MVEEVNVPQGSIVVIAAKPHQKIVPWQDYQWKLCVSYQKLNQVTTPFACTIPCRDDAVQEINT